MEAKPLAVLDTSVVVRYLTGDPPAQAVKVRGLIERQPDLRLTDSVILETAFVLEEYYGMPRAVAVDAIIRLLNRENIHHLDRAKDRVAAGLLRCLPSGRVSVADALIWAATAESPGRTVWSLDQRFPNEGITVRRPV